MDRPMDEVNMKLIRYSLDMLAEYDTNRGD
jgi:hypothetical protein